MKCLNIDVIDVKVLDNYDLFLTFSDGISGKVNISEVVPFNGVFAPLNDRNFFTRVKVNPDIGTICWENGADISPTLLHEIIQAAK